MTEGCDHVVEQGSEAGTILRRRTGGDGLAAPLESSLLTLLSDHVALPVPRVVRVLSDDALEMERMTGTALLALPFAEQRTRRRLAAELGAFVSQLAQVPIDTVAPLVPQDPPDLAEHRDEAAAMVRELGEAVPSRSRPRLRRFLSEEPPPGPDRLFLAHQDLGAEHVFVTGTYAITGIIDFSDAAIADPALDLGLVLRDLGSDAFDEAMRACVLAGEDPRGVAARATFHARARAIEDLHFGLQQGAAAYLENAVRAFADLFVDGSTTTG